MIEGIPLAGLTAPALLGLAVLMLLRGKIWSDAAYKEKREEADRWREAYEREREARDYSESHTEELLELAKTSHAVLTAMFQNSERIAQSGGTDVVKKTPSG